MEPSSWWIVGDYITINRDSTLQTNACSYMRVKQQTVKNKTKPLGIRSPELGWLSANLVWTNSARTMDLRSLNHMHTRTLLDCYNVFRPDIDRSLRCLSLKELLTLQLTRQTDTKSKLMFLLLGLWIWNWEHDQCFIFLQYVFSFLVGWPGTEFGKFNNPER